MKKFLLVLTTVSEETKGREIARRLVEERLAACVTMTSAAQSLYWWDGKVVKDREYMLVIKTKASLFSRVEKRIKELHPYQVPEILAYAVEKGSAEYLNWLDKETGD